LSHRYVETRAGVGAGPRLRIGPCELFGGLGAGLLYVHERVAAAGGTRTGDALGFYAAPALALEAPLVAHLVLALQAELQVSWLRVDEVMAARATPYLTLLVGRHL